MTKKAWGLVLIPLAIVAYLIGEVIHYNKLFAMSDPTRWLFILPPIVFSILVLVGLFMVGRRFLGVEISLTPSHLMVQGRTEVDSLSVSWRSLIYTPPGGPNLVRRLQVASSEKNIVIYDIFTPGFAFLCKEVAKRKTRSVSTDSTGDMVIDSGRLGGLLGHH